MKVYMKEASITGCAANGDWREIPIQKRHEAL